MRVSYAVFVVLFGVLLGSLHAVADRTDVVSRAPLRVAFSLPTRSSHP